MLYEYKILVLDSDDATSERILNELGAEGWKSVQTVHGSGDFPRLILERVRAADPIETSHTRAELAAAVDAAHAFLHEGRTEKAHEALHAAGAGKERVGSATRDPEAQRIVGELMTKLEGTGLPCGHKLADLIGGQGEATKCGACLAKRMTQKILAAEFGAKDSTDGKKRRTIGDLTQDLLSAESQPDPRLQNMLGEAYDAAYDKAVEWRDHRNTDQEIALRRLGGEWVEEWREQRENVRQAWWQPTVAGRPIPWKMLEK